jgi:hypothetical protein
MFAQEPGLMWSLRKVLSSCRFRPFAQALYKAGKAFQGLLLERVFVTGMPFQPFQPGKIFVGEARIQFYKVITRVGSCLANIRLGWKGEPETNALAFWPM